MTIEDAFAYEQPVDRDAQLRHAVENADLRSDDQWELEMGMDPEASFPGDAAQVHDDNEPFRRSPSPWVVARSHSPSVEVTGHRRSPSVVIMDQSPAPSVRIVDPPHLGPSSSNTPNDLLATSEELEGWAAAVREQSASPGGPRACIRATSAHAAAQTFIALLTHILRSNDEPRPLFQAPEGTIRCSQHVKVTSFAQVDCDFRV